MNRWVIAAVLALMAGNAFAQSSPGFVPGQTLGAQELNAAFAGKQDYFGSRTKLQAALTLYTDFAAGNDAASCAITAPCKTVQAAYNKIVSTFDVAGQTITIQLANTDTTCLTLNAAWGGGGNITIQGPGAANVQPTIGFSCTNNGVAVGTGVGLPGLLTLQNMVLSSGGNGASVNHFGASGMVQLNNVAFGAGGLAHLYVLGAGTKIYCGAQTTVTVTGAAVYSMLAQGGGNILCLNTAFAFLGTQNYSGALTYSRDASTVVLVGSKFCADYIQTHCARANPETDLAGITGTRFSASMNGIIDSATGNVNFIPGNAIGVLTTGGQFN